MRAKTIYKRFLIFLFLIFGCFGFQIKTVDASYASAPLATQIEILQHEILVLQTLITNYTLRQPLDSPAYVATDLSDNSIILGENTDRQYPIASITKLMTAVISLENIDINQKITLTDEMLEPEGQSPVIFSGMEITAQYLLEAMLIQSSNDAAQSLSYFVGNKKFISLMNQKAKELGMENTAYYDVHGLNPDNHSTASDLAKLVSYLNKNHPDIWEITKNNDFWLPDAKGNVFKFQNVNNFYYWANFVGGKTGYIPQAKQSLASVFNVDGKQVAIIVLYSKNRVADAFNIIRQLENKI
jgi:D-alanyl-D-alanine carboxypeptidase